MLPDEAIEEQAGGRYGALVRREDWAARLADTVAGQVRYYRRERGMTAQQLVDECNAIGLPMKRTVLTNLENGRRGNVSVAELLALAEALHVPPLLLLFPLGRAPEVEVLPGFTINTWNAIRQFTGEIAEQPAGFGPLNDYREHDSMLRTWLATRASARSTRSFLRNPIAELTDAEREKYLRDAQTDEQTAAELEGRLRHWRRRMRIEGLEPPELSQPLRYLDDDEVGSR